ncbi:AraC family transcriptional regulator [Nocardia cyriacigeorgica]|uniref:AraC family transcriptional regulator n=1 Tax=Nocardia cyriacigeorgica TaxID=135487 RepID=UPI0024586C0E|nr:helix-turn-helix domain-containing protein [Nocardia cyriacigeorgica]
MNEREVIVGGPTISTTGVSARESFEQWTSIMSESVVPCSMAPLGDGNFSGSLTPVVESADLAIAAVANSAEIARRNRRHIASTGAPYVIAGLALSGISDIACDGRYLRAPAGTMFIVDGEVPQEARTTEYKGVLIRISKPALMRSAGLHADDFPAATVLEPVAHGALVIDYFRRLATLPPQALRTTALLNAGIELVGAAVALEAGGTPADSAGQTLDRELVVRFLRERLSDPALNADRIAQACGISRRTLFRVLGDEDGGPMALLRRLRTERACELLISAPDRTVASIAAACGFAGDRNFYRVFRGETGMTPAEYRENVLFSPV